jgi:succinylarginine dihydrolase
MRNGGGPACLRLRAVLTPAEWADVSEGVKFSDQLYSCLSSWVKRYYRDRVVPGDLLDPELLKESRAAAQELDHLLGFSSVSTKPRKL